MTPAAAPNLARVRWEARLWVAQRLTAMVLAVCVLVHLVTIILAVRGGLSAAEIMARTRGSAAWLGFYGLFVLMVAIHAPIGLRNIVTESFGWRGRSLDIAVALFAMFLVLTGWRTILGLYR